MLDSITFINGPFGCQIPRFPPHDKYVYELHFSSRYYHVGHYIGYTTNLQARLQLHRTGQGAKLTRAVAKAHISMELVRLWKVETCEEGHRLERALKNRHDGAHWCPVCQGQPLDALVALKQGHWPLELHQRPGPRRPTGEHAPCFVRYSVPTTLWQLL